MTKLQSFTYPGLDWLTIMLDPREGVITASVTLRTHLGHFRDTVTMSEKDIGPGGELLLKEAYLCRAKLMVVYKAAEALEDD